MKTLTRKQLETRKAKAVRFLRDVKEDNDRADEIDGDDPAKQSGSSGHTGF